MTDNRTTPTQQGAPSYVYGKDVLRILLPKRDKAWQQLQDAPDSAYALASWELADDEFRNAVKELMLRPPPSSSERRDEVTDADVAALIVDEGVVIATKDLLRPSVSIGEGRAGVVRAVLTAWNRRVETTGLADDSPKECGNCGKMVRPDASHWPCNGFDRDRNRATTAGRGPSSEETR